LTASGPAEVAAAVADAHRREWAFVLAATVRVTRDLDDAEEAVQDAYARALETWPARGIPANPAAWLTAAARHRALDLLRRADVARRAQPKLIAPDAPGPDELASAGEESPVADDRLRLIFTCCHPALAFESRVALTLRLVCGLSTAEVARAFLVPDATMAARITRAKRKIAEAGIPYRVPVAAELRERLGGVLDVVHLVYTTGHTAPEGADLTRRELTERGLELAELLRLQLPAEPDVAGLLALLYLTEARRRARVDADGAEVMLEHQDRSLWDRVLIEKGLGLLATAVDARPPSRFTLLAAIGAVHDTSTTWTDTDWRGIRELYDTLRQVWPSPVVSLNRAIAVGFADGPESGLALLDELAADPRLARYPYLQASRAEFLLRIGRPADAVLAYDEALLLTGNDAEREQLRRRREAALDASPGSGDAAE
jgi:RNA polymerase sigma factor (sigma-70 family)